jgi:pyruvate formate lyase activating enzyme
MRIRIVGVAGWHKNSFIDFPGTVSTVLFFSGCNLACPYCHNPDVVRATTSMFLAPDEIADFLEKRKGLIDGVVLSGGEPTLRDDIAEIASSLRGLGYRVKLDTNGLLPEIVSSVAADYLAVDVKTSPELYGALLACPYGNARQRLGRTLDVVRSMGDNAEVRITVAPGIVDRDILRHIGEFVNGVRKAFLQPMKKKGELLDPSIVHMNEIGEKEIAIYRDILSEFVGTCAIRGEE